MRPKRLAVRAARDGLFLPRTDSELPVDDNSNHSFSSEAGSREIEHRAARSSKLRQILSYQYVEDEEQGRLGILLAEDMQPSTGAWGGIGWLNYTYSFNQADTVRAYSTLSYSYNGENDRNYRFGHEGIVELGGSYHPRPQWGLLAGMRYRHTERDERNSVEVPNTGGEWIDFVPAIQYHFTDSLAGKLGATLPVWRDLNDSLQFTTKYAAHLSLSYVF